MMLAPVSNTVAVDTASGLALDRATGRFAISRHTVERALRTFPVDDKPRSAGPFRLRSIRPIASCLVACAYRHTNSGLMSPPAVAGRSVTAQNAMTTAPTTRTAISSDRTTLPRTRRSVGSIRVASSLSTCHTAGTR